MDQTPNLALPYIMAAQAQKHVTHNEAIRALDALVQLAVLDRGLATPPAGPADGDRYIVAPSPTGAWAGQAGKVAAFQDGAWIFFAPRHGFLAWVADENALVAYDGAAWALAGGGGGSVNPTPLVGVNATADTTNRLAVASPASLFDHEGAGHQLKINKAAAANTASLLYQDGFSGRAELGLAGDDNLHVKVSADGTAWKEAVIVDRASGAVALPLTPGSGADNLLVNGDFRLNQRGFGGGALTAGSYGHDRWKAAAGGANYTIAGFTIALASGELEQVIEPAFWGLATLASTQLTISVESPSADLAVALGSATGTIPAGSGRRSVTMSTVAGDTGNLSLKIKRLVAGAVTFARVRLEVGANANAWSARPTGAELDLARWYYQVHTSLQITLTNDTSVPRNIATAVWPQMRTTPVITITAGGIVGQHTTAPTFMTGATTSAGFQWTGAAYRNLTGAGTVSFNLSAEL